jgi:hypothetical protein
MNIFVSKERKYLNKNFYWVAQCLESSLNLKFIIAFLVGKTSTGCFRWHREGVDGEGDSGGYLINVQCKAIQNCHNESLLYNECMLIKMEKVLLGTRCSLMPRKLITFEVYYCYYWWERFLPVLLLRAF